jgi:diketogulonate reductase-like aldo/keto reductase
VTPAQVALAWLLTRPAVSSLVVGGRTEAQFVENFGAVEVRLTEEDLTRLNDASRLPLIYPYWHQHNFARTRFSEADRALHADYPDRHYGGFDPLV